MTYEEHRRHQLRLMESLERVPTRLRETYVRACEALAEILSTMPHIGPNGGSNV